MQFQIRRIPLRYKVVFGAALLIFINFKFSQPSELNWDFSNESDLGVRPMAEGLKHEKWIVVTTIQKPTEAMKQLASISDWKVVVVGDRVTPKAWRLPNVVYLDVAAQKSLKYRIHAYLPYDSYTRKMIGYLFAIERGAQYIYETDDDNLVFSLTSFHTKRAYKALVPDTDDIAYNPYPHFGQPSMWPRGYPLEYISSDSPTKYLLCSVHTPAIQQGLVDEEPDVDAIFRLTRKKQMPSKASTKIHFDNAAPVVVVPDGTFAPFNSQNTLFLPSAFWALVLPTMVSTRASDIIRSYWAQKLLWLIGNNIAFYPPTVKHQRNDWHTNIRDAKSEQMLYTTMGNYINFLHKWTCSKLFFFDCVLDLTNDLVRMSYWDKRDADLVEAWIADLSSIGYAPPIIKQTRQKHNTCTLSDSLSAIFYPWEQNTTLPNIARASLVQETSNLELLGRQVSTVCGVSHQVYLQNAIMKAAKYNNVLLVVTLYADVSVIPFMDSVYKIHFPHILYCASVKIEEDLVKKWRVSYLELQGATPVACVNEASKMGYNVAGYLHITKNMFLQFEKLHVSERNMNQLWVTGLDLYIFKNTVSTLCKSGEIKCTSMNKESFFTLAAKIKELGEDIRKVGEYVKCVQKVGSDPTLKTSKVTTSKELSFYIPHRLSGTLHEVTEFLSADATFQDFEFLTILILECLEITPEYLHSSDIEDSETMEHYDYIFPFVFNSLVKHTDSDTITKRLYCDYIENQ